ncbi:MAG: hypothetical protein H6667_08565 [Ardenticatenaceae bacterium]|nr:hypothetical protein [Ardenticatenaceae bacterium]MCB9445800.1 hypothetical protein [Ardenticatenaceae bacterium]
MAKKAAVQSRWRTLIFALIFLTVIATIYQPGSAAQTISSETEDHFVYLPLITYTISKGIYGSVSFGSLGLWADVSLDLRFFNGSEWSTIASTTTDENGVYSFKNMPSLQAGQRYYIRFLNTEASGYLYTWRTLPITAYQAGQEVHAGDFNIVDINLIAPYSGAQMYLPLEFRWHLRGGLLTDSYEFNLFEPQTSTPYFYTDPPLGFVDRYTLASLPTGFHYNTWYLWDVWVYGPNGNAEGDWGISYWSYYVSFSAPLGSDTASIRIVKTADIVPLLIRANRLPSDFDLGE